VRHCGTPESDSSALPERPRFRGVLHLVAFFAACVIGAVFVAYADGGRVTVAAAIFAASVVTMLAISALYHRVIWGPRARLWLRRADHAGVYFLIAGTYTPVGLLAMHGVLQRVVLGIVWGGAFAAALTKFCWVHAPKWLSVALGISLGWVGVAAMPQLERHAGPGAVALLAAGGVAYTAGAIVYARRKPDPIPSVFGYHEVFHALTLVALACQYTAIAFFVVKVG
jgi:hemolysin III